MDEKNELIKKYRELFGEDAPLPPDHLLKTVVEMEESGKMEELYQMLSPALNEILDEMQKVTGMPMGPDHSLFDLDLSEEE